MDRSTIGLHEVQILLEPHRFEALDQTRYVFFKQGLNIRIAHRRGRPLVLTNFRHDFAGNANGHIGQQGLQDFFRLQLMPIVSEGMQKANGDRLSPGIPNLLGDGFKRLDVQGLDHGAIKCHPLLDFETQ